MSSSMLGDSGGLGSSGEDTVVAGAHEGEEAGVFGSTSGEEDKGRGDDHEGGGDRNNCGGNRWPRPETLALLKIRSDMDAVFRDSSLKAPLWEEVSRKLGELGYNRSAKKCKEKFENVYKYHKRTKEGRTGKAEGKNYRFFDQLQALENQPKLQNSFAVPWTNTPISVSQITVPSTTNHTNMIQNAMFTPISLPTIHPLPATTTTSPQTTNPRVPLRKTIASSLQNMSSNLFSSSTSSSTASDEEFKGGQLKRKRKWRNFFERLARDVIEKQEELQKKFLEAIDKHEHKRMVREEAWRTQEMGRINREHEILVQERSTAAAKDAAVISFLQKISGQQYPTTQTHNNNISIPTLPPPPPPPMPRLPALTPLSVNNSDIQKIDGCDTPTSSSRWPKSEVQALIKLRTNLDIKYHENGAKGPLWEEISAGMRRLGYSRSAKRCKEKWENINKYFKKVKESNRKRPEDSKTCPYFHQLDDLYKEKNKIDNSLSSPSVNNNNNNVKPINLMEPLMVRPEQQWPLQQEKQHQQEAAMEDIDHSKNGEDGDSSDEEEEYEEGGGFEIVTNNKPSSMEIVE